VGRLDHDLGATDVGVQRLQRLLDDELDADRGGQVDDRVALVYQLVHEKLVQYRSGDEPESWVRRGAGEIGQPPRGEVVERQDVLAALQQRVDQV